MRCRCEGDTCSCEIPVEEIAGVRVPSRPEGGPVTDWSTVKLDEVNTLDREFLHVRDGEDSLEPAVRQFVEIHGHEPRLRGSVRGSSGEASESGPMAMAFDELLGDRAALDRAIKAVMVEEDLDYLPALERLEFYFSLGGEDSDAGAPLLGDVVPDKGTFRRDMGRLASRDAEREQAISCDDAITPDPGGDVDDRGYVVLESADQGATLLTDAHAQEVAYLNAIELGEAKPGEAGRHDFNDVLHMHVEAGLNWPATLQRQKRDAEIAVRRAQEDARSMGRLNAERRKRAEDRAASDELQAAHDRLQRSR